MESYGTKKYLELLSKEYRNIAEVSEEIINLQAILNLPKGTEVFLSDIHGEYDSFNHILNSGSGIIRSKIEAIFGNTITEEERNSLATLIYYPVEKLAMVKKEVKKENLKEWYSLVLYRLVQVAREVTSKYTRSKVRKALPKEFDYILDELLHFNGGSGTDKEAYYKQIIQSIIDLHRANEFIEAISAVIKRMAIDHLHLLGDIYDRGPNPDLIIEDLMKFHSLDIQIGNHEVLWMGAASGNETMIANVVRICARYDNLGLLEEYGINLTPVMEYAMEQYKEDTCENFMPKILENRKRSSSDVSKIAKVQKAMAILQFKLEGNLLLKHPEYEMDSRLLLDKVEYNSKTIIINGKQYHLTDTNFPTVDRRYPYALTKEESELIEKLKNSFRNSEKLNKHIAFLYAKGSVYTTFNSNLLFHGCIPLDEKGNMKKVKIMGGQYKGKNYLDYVGTLLHKAYFETDEIENHEANVDVMWFLWCSPDSPFFGKDKAATFERYLIQELEAHKEVENPYYRFVEEEKVCNKILEEFELNPETSHIINGHVPVKSNRDESPIRAGGKLIITDGEFLKAYKPKSERTGYTLTYNSYGLVLTENQNFTTRRKAIKEEISKRKEIFVTNGALNRKRVADTDIGKRLKSEISDLKMLLAAYREGMIKEKR